MMEKAKAARRGQAKLVPTIVNGRSEMLPSDPYEVVRILRERRSEKTYAGRIKALLMAEAAKRGIK